MFMRIIHHDYNGSLVLLKLSMKVLMEKLGVWWLSVTNKAGKRYNLRSPIQKIYPLEINDSVDIKVATDVKSDICEKKNSECPLEEWQQKTQTVLDELLTHN